MTRRSRALVGLTVAASALCVGHGTAGASYQTVTLGNGCRIYGSNQTFGNSNGYTREAYSLEVSGCASVQAKLQWYDTNAGIWKVDSTTYETDGSAGPFTRLSTSPNGYTDHNGKNSSAGTALGFRLSAP